VTTRANVEVSGLTVKTCLIKHRWNNWYKPLSKLGTHARIKHVWYAAVQTNKTLPIKRANKRNLLRFWSNVWWPSNFIKLDQTRSDTIKPHQSRCPNGKMFGHQTTFEGVWSPNIYRLSRPLTVWPLTSTLACLVTKQCFMVIGRQTFPVCPGPNIHVCLIINTASYLIPYSHFLHIFRFFRQLQQLQLQQVSAHDISIIANLMCVNVNDFMTLREVQWIISCVRKCLKAITEESSFCLSRRPYSATSYI